MQVVRINKCLLGDSLMSAGLRKIQLHPTPRQPCVHPALSVFLKKYTFAFVAHLYHRDISVGTQIDFKLQITISSWASRWHKLKLLKCSECSGALQTGGDDDWWYKKMKLIPLAKRGPFPKCTSLDVDFKRSWSWHEAWTKAPLLTKLLITRKNNF